MKYALNTLMLSPDISLLEKIKIASKAGFYGIEPWIYEIETQNANEIKKCCGDYNIEIPTVEQIRGWFENDGELMDVADSHDKIMDECRRRMSLSASIGAKWIIATPAFSHRNHFADWNQGVEYFRELIEIGKTEGCLPTIEFMGQTKQINNFSKCKKFIDDVGLDSTMVIDAYHLWKGGGTVCDFKDLDPSRIAVLHISDADKNIKLADHMDRNRVMPLDGQIDLLGFAKTVREIKYNGFINIGVYNKKLWDMDPNFVAKDSVNRLIKLFE